MKKIKVSFLLNSLDVDFYALKLIDHIKKSNLYFYQIFIYGYKKKKTFLERLKWINKRGIVDGIDRIIIIFLLKFIKFAEVFNVKKKFSYYKKIYSIK